MRPLLQIFVEEFSGFTFKKSPSNRGRESKNMSFNSRHDLYLVFDAKFCASKIDSCFYLVCCPTIHYSALYCSVLHCNSILRTVLQCTRLHQITLLFDTHYTHYSTIKYTTQCYTVTTVCYVLV